MNEQKRLLPLIYWAGPLVFCGLLYLYSFKAWFYQDDFAWLHLRADISGWRDLLRAIFTPSHHGTFRPWSERGFFLLFQQLFGLDALPSRLWIFLTQFANLLLLNSIVRRLTASPAAGFWAAIFWIANSNLAITMTWTSAYMQILCGFCILLAFYLLLRYIETGRRRVLIWQWAVFLFGFGVMETNFVFPALAASYTWLFARKHFRQTLLLFIPSILFVGLHMVLAPKQSTGPYSVHIDSAIVNTLWTYWKWSLAADNLLEIEPIPSWSPALLVALLTAALLGFAALKLKQNQWTAALFLSWFVILLAPVLPLRDHLTTYYLTLPTIGLASLGAWAFVSAWRSEIFPRVAATVLAASYLITSMPAARFTSRWWYENSHRAEVLVMGVARGHELHPSRTILLDGVDSDLFWGCILHRPFGLVGVDDVFLTPGSESHIEPHPELGDPSVFVLPLSLTRHLFERGEAVVYTAGVSRLKNSTGDFRVALLANSNEKKPHLLDMSFPGADRLLTGAWHEREIKHRWMGKKAAVSLAGPDSSSQRLYISGACPDLLLQSTPLELAVFIDGKPARIFPIAQAGPFAFDLDLPAGSVGKDSVEVGLEVNHTYRDPVAKIDFGLVFGILQIR